MKYYKVSEKVLHWYIKDFLMYNALKNGGLYEGWNRAFDVLYDAMWDDEEEYEMTSGNVFDYFSHKADNILKHMEEIGLMEEK
jgi:hypothetical protein